MRYFSLFSPALPEVVPSEMVLQATDSVSACIGFTFLRELSDEKRVILMQALTAPPSMTVVFPIRERTSYVGIDRKTIEALALRFLKMVFEEDGLTVFCACLEKRIQDDMLSSLKVLSDLDLHGYHPIGEGEPKSFWW